MTELNNLFSYLDQRNLLLPQKRTLILNLGFGKCGSTSMQSKLLPFLPFSSYSYQGRYYKINREKNKLFPHDKVNDMSSMISSKKFSLLSRAVSDAFDKRNCVCFSSELLPSDFSSAVQAAQCLTKSLDDDIEVIYLFGVRNARMAAFSSYVHSVHQYFQKENQFYSINDVIFDNVEAALGLGFSKEDFFTVCGKRPIAIDQYDYSGIIAKFLQSAARKSSSFIIDVNALSSSQRFWRDLFSRVIGQECTIDGGKILRDWMCMIDQLSPVNFTPSKNKKLIPFESRSIDAENEKKLQLIELKNCISYPRLGNYYS